jgi:hypothetical protein
VVIELQIFSKCNQQATTENPRMVLLVGSTDEITTAAHIRASCNAGNQCIGCRSGRRATLKPIFGGSVCPPASSRIARRSKGVWPAPCWLRLSHVRRFETASQINRFVTASPQIKKAPFELSEQKTTSRASRTMMRDSSDWC